MVTIDRDLDSAVVCAESMSPSKFPLQPSDLVTDISAAFLMGPKYGDMIND